MSLIGLINYSNVYVRMLNKLPEWLKEGNIQDINDFLASTNPLGGAPLMRQLQAQIQAQFELAAQEAEVYISLHRWD